MSAIWNPDGTVAVNRRKYPTLFRCAQRGAENSGRAEWQKVVDLRRDGKDDAADRMVRKILGIQGPVMTEEVKAKLRAYNEAHKEEIKERRKQERAIRRAVSRPRKGGRR